jgi:hypothetical protein
MKNKLKPKIYEKYPTITAFAAAVKMRDNRISQFITGRLHPSKAEKRVIARKLGCEINEVFPDQN